jgi:surfeit locus 1 family protein
MTGTKTGITLPFWATLLTILGVVILCILGSWQIQRLTWKNDIIAKLESAYKNPLESPALSELKEDGFIYASIKGRFLFDKSILLGHTIQDEQPGQFLITPLQTKQGTLLINMGFNPSTEKLEDHFLKSYTGENITFTGLIRKPHWNSFTPENVPENDIWYRPDIFQIATAKDLKNPIPFMMYADSASQKFDAQFPNNTLWQPNNNHAQYAFFWFTLAGALVVIYVLRFLKRNN